MSTILSLKRAAIAVITPFAMAACTQPPPHTHEVDGRYVPDAGYSWRDPDQKNVIWTEGLPHLEKPHITSGPVVNQWQADPGYVFPVEGVLDVKWESGRGHPQHAHVSSAEQEGSWIADDGYTWVDASPSSSNLDTVWKPGIKSRLHSHIRAYTEEGKWLAEPGYKFIDPQKNLSVRWVKGSVHPNDPHAIAGEMEETWFPEAGYHFVEQDGKVFSQRDQEADVGKAAIQFGAAVAAHSCAQDEDDDGWFTTIFIRPGCRQIRNELTRESLKSLGLKP